LVQPGEIKKPGSYVKLEASQVPSGWTNCPEYLGLSGYFADEADSIKDMLKTAHNIPDARPILGSLYSWQSWYLLDGGDEKHYLLDEASGA
jgi:hypothetical protein